MQPIKARRVGISVAFDDATDCHGDSCLLIIGEVNCRHSANISGRHLPSKESGDMPRAGVWVNSPLFSLCSYPKMARCTHPSFVKRTGYRTGQSA